MLKDRQPVGLWGWACSQFFLWRGAAHRHFGIRNHSREEFVHAVEDYTRALAHNPELGPAYLQRGVIYWRELDQAAEAVTDLSAALAVQPDWPEALFCRGLALQATGNWRGAMRDLSRYLALDDNTWREAAQRQLALVRALVQEAAKE